MALSQEESEALTVFADCQTQWNVVAGIGGGGLTGLIYPSAETAARSLGLEWWASDMLSLIKICEQVILDQDAARREAEKS